MIILSLDKTTTKGGLLHTKICQTLQKNQDFQKFYTKVCNIYKRRIIIVAKLKREIHEKWQGQVFNV